MSTTWVKERGLPVFAPHDDAAGDCVIARILAAEPARAEVTWPAGFGAGISHRLDNWTSGALLLADDPRELAWIREAFREKLLLKTYIFRTATRIKWQSHRCEAPIAHEARRRPWMVAKKSAHTAHRGEWYPAETVFDYLGGGIVRARMSTGVMHQIRLHAAEIGAPLLGDEVYGGPPSEDGGFFLHHVGLVGPRISTMALPKPPWVDQVHWERVTTTGA